MTVELPTVITFEEITERYPISLRTLKEHARAGLIEHIRFGNTWAMTPEQVDKFLKSRTHRTEADQALDVVRERVARKQQRRKVAA